MRYSILKFTLEYHQTVFLSEPPQLIQNCTYRGSRDLINVQLCTNLGVLFRSLVLSFGIGGKLGALDGLQGLGQGARQGSARARFSPRLSLLETDLRIDSRSAASHRSGIL